jgi:hypothetical protein
MSRQTSTPAPSGGRAQSGFAPAIANPIRRAMGVRASSGALSTDRVLLAMLARVATDWGEFSSTALDKLGGVPEVGQLHLLPRLLFRLLWHSLLPACTFFHKAFALSQRYQNRALAPVMSVPAATIPWSS